MSDAYIEQTHREEGRALLRVTKDLREMVANAPADDLDVQSLLRDCDTLERVGRWLLTCSPIRLQQDGIDTAASAPHVFTPDGTKNRCRICGDGVWGRHRFTSNEPESSVRVYALGETASSALLV